MLGERVLDTLDRAPGEVGLVAQALDPGVHILLDPGLAGRRVGRRS
jgi:hypothetical protein